MLFEKIYNKASLCREFETEVFKQVQNKNVTIPVYLSAGQEYIPATIAAFVEDMGFEDRQIFIQHRGHSSYLSFGGDVNELILELLGDSEGCANGMGGSASIQSKKAKIYGHDGLMGSHGPIAVGMCYANKKPTIVFTGDAAAEEDYFLASIAWAATKNLPILFVVEDNNLSILTEKKVRRSWEMHDVARGFGMTAHDINDDPNEIIPALKGIFEKPILLNIKTNRMFWHAGAGIDDPNIFDRHKEFAKNLDTSYVKYTDFENSNLVRLLWNQAVNRLEK
ncbi:MAG: thiamine pyrophosphate-dependent enzyme [Minisyncoccia bacterium]